jgi:hypothetical protein
MDHNVASTRFAKIMGLGFGVELVGAKILKAYA